MFWTCLVNLNQFWVVLASYVPFRSLYQIVFCSVLFWEKVWSLNLFMNEIADGYRKSTLHNWLEVITKFSFSDKWSFTRQQIFIFTGLHSNGNSLQQQFWVKAQGVMFFSLNREIERISCILFHRLTRSQTRLQTQDSDSSDMSLPETGVIQCTCCRMHLYAASMDDHMKNVH